MHRKRLGCKMGSLGYLWAGWRGNLQAVQPELLCLDLQQPLANGWIGRDGPPNGAKWAP